MSTNKSTNQRPSREAGFSLVEIMVTSLIIGLVAWLASSYFGKSQKQAVQQIAHDQSATTKQSLADLLKRDLAYVTDPADVVINSLHEITIKRTQLIPGNNRPDLSQTYQVRYRAVCAPVPQALQSQLSGFNFAALPAALKARSSCAGTATLQCGSGRYPQLLVEPDVAANIPVYHGKAFPDLTRQPKIHQAPLGVMACFQRSGNQVTVGLDVLYAKDVKGSSLDVVGERYYMVIGNVSDMVILQK